VQPFDAIVLAGGSARRLGGADKALIEISGRTLLGHVLDAVRDATSIIAVGPRRDGLDRVRWCREDPPGGGPVAALAAALPFVEEELVLVLATDLPNIAPAVPLLRTAAAGGDAAVLVADARRNYLAAAWPTAALRRQVALIGDPAGASVRSLFEGATVTEVVDPSGWSADCDTWEDIEQMRRGSR
jgi:molybdopterin-guanine dinucleotide biosynthesis protein A